MVSGVKRKFSLKADALFCKLHLKSFLITELVQTCTQFIVNLKNCPNYVINMFFECFDIYHVK